MVGLKQSTWLFTDETCAPVSDPEASMTKIRYFWAVARDERPWGGSELPSVTLTYSRGPSGHHAEWILRGFGHILRVGGDVSYSRPIAPDRVGSGIQLAHFWAHARRHGAVFVRFSNGGKMSAADHIAQAAGVFRGHCAGANHAGSKTHFTSSQPWARDERWMVSTRV
jgi:transposase